MTDPAVSPHAAGDEQPQPGERRLLADWRFQMGAIIALALIPRVIYLVQIHQWPFFYSPILDSRTQNNWAEILIRSFGIGNNEVTAKPPLYAYFLALNKVAVGSGSPSLFAARLVQLVLGAVTCGITYLVGRRVFGPAVGIVAGLLLAFYSPGIFAEGELLDTALATFLATSLLIALLATLAKPSSGRWFGVGLLLGLLGLSRGNMLLLVPLVAALLIVWLRQTDLREEMGTMVAAFLVGVVVIVAPITFRNLLISGMFIPISTNGSINFYTGNNPDADGYSPIPSGLAWERTWYEQVSVGPEGTARSLGTLSSRQQESYWLSKGLAFWRQQPSRALALLVKKTYLYWAAYDIPNNVSYDWGRAHASLLRAVPLTFAAVGPLALLGIALGGWRKREARVMTLFIACQMAAVIIFFVCGRYRTPAVPVMCVFAGVALVELVRLGRERRWRLLAGPAVGLAALVGLVNADLYGVGRARGANRDWFYLGQSYAMQQDFARAGEACEKAVAADPKDADAWQLLGNMSRQQGDLEGARRALRSALEAAPDFGNAASQLGVLALTEGWPLEEPKRLLLRALQSQPNHLQGLAALARINVRLGEAGEAAVALRALAAAFVTWNRADTRYSNAQSAVYQAVAEAQAAGVVVPHTLQGGQESMPTRIPGGRRQQR